MALLWLNPVYGHRARVSLSRCSRWESSLSAVAPFDEGGDDLAAIGGGICFA